MQGRASQARVFAPNAEQEGTLYNGRNGRFKHSTEHKQGADTWEKKRTSKSVLQLKRIGPPFRTLALLLTWNMPKSCRDLFGKFVQREYPGDDR